MIRLDPHSLYTALLDGARDELKATLSELKAHELQQIQQASSELGILIARRIKETDEVKAAMIDTEIAFIQASIANWTWVGADKVRARWQKHLEDAAELIGKLLKQIGKGLIA